MSDQGQTQARRVTVRFEGRVQGVGFRFTTIEIASRFHVTGYVRNESDGSVTVVAEGDEAEVGRFLRAVRGSYVGRFVMHEDVEWSPATGEFPDFSVRYNR